MNRRSRYGWMALGGLLCLFGVVAFFKWRDGGRALAQSQPLPAINDKGAELPPLPPLGAEALQQPATPKPPVSEVTLTGATVPPPPPVNQAPPPPPPSEAKAPEPKKDVPPLGSDPRPIIIPGSATQTPAPPAPPVTPPPVPTSTPPPAPESTPPGSPLPPVKPPEPKGDPVTPVKVETKDHHGEPPLAPTPGPVVTYRLPKSGETFRSLAKKALSNENRWHEIHKLNPTIKADAVLVAGTVLRLPADACVSDEAESLRALPALRSRPAPKVKVALPLTGTYPLTLDDNKGLTLPKAVQAQLGNCDTVLASPGSDRCLWLTNQAQLDRLAGKLDKSPARETDVRTFKRLYYAQTVKVSVKDGRVILGDKLTQFAGLHQEVVLVGIDDHFEVWDAARWRRYTQTKKAATED